MIQIPTHLRFKFKKDATNWGSDTKEWHKIQTINPNKNSCSIATNSFAWVEVSYDKPCVEFKNDQSDAPPLMPTTFSPKLVSDYYTEKRQGFYYQNKLKDKGYFQTYEEMEKFNKLKGRPENYVINIDVDGNIEEYSI